MPEKFAEKFYHSWAWERCRNAYVRAHGGLCEQCAARGLAVPGTQVHHKKHLTPDNLADTSVTLSWDNLILLCDACHRNAHKNEPRYTISASGEVEL